jgi:cell division septation protein DedD
MAVVGVIMVMTPRTGTMEISDEAWVSSTADGISEQSDQLADQPSESSVPEELTEGLIQSTEQVQAPADAVSDPGINPANNQSVTDSAAALGNELASDTPEQEVTASGSVSGLEILPVPAAGKDSVSTPDDEDADKPGDTASSTRVATTEPAPPTQETVREGGRWVINLASVANKKDAESFIAQAKSRGVTAELYQVTVKGKKRWRVHVSGFATDAEARAEARLIKEKLGIDDVWIAKR